MKGLIFDIQHFSIHDGPGIRTTVFFKGCPLRCLWCHNPEGFEKRQELSYFPRKCVSCGACVSACPVGAHKIDEDGKHVFDRTLCRLCLSCVGACSYGALEITGKEFTLDEVMFEVMKDKVFYDESGGGITLSGGEPFAQPDFAIALLKLAKENGLHTCIETSGYVNSNVILEAAKYTDLFLFDIKERTEKRHIELTGVSNEIILRNLNLLCDENKSVILRCPMVPSLNDRDDNIEFIAELAMRYDSITEVHIEPYHPLGISKSAQLGKESSYDRTEFMEKTVAEEIAEKIRSIMGTNGKIVKIM